MIRIYADFNARTTRAPEGGCVPLFCNGSLRDIRRQKVELHEGLHVIVYDDGCEAEAMVVKFQGDWWAQIVGAIRQIPEEEALRRIGLLLSKDLNDDSTLS
jgi:hypothetical protein